MQLNHDFLNSFGWNESFEASLREILAEGALPDLSIARLIGQERSFYRAQFSASEVHQATLMNRTRNQKKTGEDLPAVGDWVLCAKQGKEFEIRHVLKRRSTLKRLRPTNKTVVQMMACNVDYVLLAVSLHGPLDLSRILRYLEICRDSGAEPVLVLTKSDLVSDRVAISETLAQEFPKLTYVFITQENTDSFALLKPYFKAGTTSVLIGSSGVGKSTLFNFLVGTEAQKTQTVSNDAKGRHTTTSRTLTPTIWGGLVIDTPGMMDVLSSEDEDAVEEDFADIETLGLTCRFTNCEHGKEPGCSIQKALKDGSLAKEHWEKYRAHLAHASMMRKRRGR